MAEHAFDDDNDPHGYWEHIARLEKERVWVPLFAGACGLVSYYFNDIEFTGAEQAIIIALVLGVWAIFNEVRTSRIEALRCIARREDSKIKSRKLDRGL